MTLPIVRYCRDASAVPGFQIVETAQRDVRTRNIRGWGSGREGKGTSSLPLILLFVLCSLTSRCTLLPQCLEQARYSEGYIGVSSIIHLNIFVVKFSSKIEWSKTLLFFLDARGRLLSTKEGLDLFKVSVYFEGKYQTSIFYLYNSVLTYCAPILK